MGRCVAVTILLKHFFMWFSSNQSRTPGQKQKRQHSSDVDRMPLASLPGLAASLSPHLMPADSDDAQKYQVS